MTGNINELYSDIYSGSAIKVIPDTAQKEKFVGIDTLEGFAWHLIKGSKLQAYSLEMPSGLLVPEHPESIESIIYTVKGNWILISEGIRYHMGPGSMFWFNEGMSTGCEVPFDEPAVVLTFLSPNGAQDDITSKLVRSCECTILMKARGKE